VSVPVARWLGDRLAAPHRYKYICGKTDFPLANLTRSTSDSLHSAKVSTAPCTGAASDDAPLPSGSYTADGVDELGADAENCFEGLMGEMCNDGPLGEPAVGSAGGTGAGSGDPMWMDGIVEEAEEGEDDEDVDGALSLCSLSECKLLRRL
jgi:hypothetical protein